MSAHGCISRRISGNNLDREDLEQIAGSAGYGSINNVKHGEMEDFFIDFALVTTARDADFTKLTTTNANLSTRLRHQEDQIRALQVDFLQPQGSGSNSNHRRERLQQGITDIGTREKKPQWPTNPMEKKYNNKD